MKRLIAIVVVIGSLVGGLLWLLQEEQGAGEEQLRVEGKLRVVTTTTMVTDMVKIIGGGRIGVQGLMGPGVDPHSYQITFNDTVALQQADIIFYSGLHLEGKMQDLLEKRASKQGGVFAVTDGVAENLLLKPREEFQGYYDPHVWGDPKLWQRCIEVVVNALCEADPAAADDYKTRAKAYSEQLLELHLWAERRMAEIPEEQRVLVTSHDAFLYFGEAFGIEVKGLQGVSTNSESGLKDRAELVAFIKSKQLKSIFPESSVNAKGIRAVAEEAGVRVSEHELFSDAMGQPGDLVTLHGETYDRGTYIGMIKHNVNTIVDGLK
ncbi:MAG: metal ABC transporter solute-binding protein, Zn/Mn family [Akkermansiaceae bacterium]